MAKLGERGRYVSQKAVRKLRQIWLISGTALAVAAIVAGMVPAVAQSSLTVIDHVRTTAQSLCVVAAGSHAYIANQYDGLRIYDISHPQNPVVVGHVNDGGLAWNVIVAGNLAYLANGQDGLRIYDVSNPTNIISLGHVQVSSSIFGTRAVALSGNLAFTANFYDGVRIYDVKHPKQPKSIGFIDCGDYPQAVALSGRYAYVANDLDGVRVYDVLNPAKPTEVGHVFSGGAASDITIVGRLAYVANGTDGLRIYGISNPTNLIAVGHAFTNAPGWNIGGAFSVSVSGHYVSVANLWDGVRIYDVADPANPVNVGHGTHPDSYGPCYSVTTLGDSILSADAESGLWLYSSLPRLAINRTNDALSISWYVLSTNHTFALQQATRAPVSGNWETLTKTAVVDGGRSQITLPTPAANTFFRLRATSKLHRGRPVSRGAPGPGMESEVLRYEP